MPPSSVLRLRKSSAIGLGLVAVALVSIAAIGRVHARSPRAHAARRASITVEAAAIGPAIPSGFVGISIEDRTLETYAGADQRAIDPVFEQLTRNLAPGQRPWLRIGGDTTDWTWWPIRGMERPLGVRYSLTSRWLNILRALTESLRSHLIVGVNLEVNSRRVAAAEAEALVHALGRNGIDGLEIGNEPELYDAFAWFMMNGRRYYGRPFGYSFHDFVHDFSNVASALPRVRLAGPDSGSPEWMPYLNQFLAGQPRVKLATLHRYPLKRCSDSVHETIGQLLADSSARGLARSVARYAAIAHAHGIPLRIDEMNAVSCGGEAGVSNTFASALWSIDALFQLARVGVDGVNIHTRPGSSGELFSFSRSHGAWRATVNPEYYGLIMFAQAAPPGSRMLRIAGRTTGAVRAWATRESGGRIRVMLINKGRHEVGNISLRIKAAAGAGTLERLLAPNARTDDNLTVGGQSFGSSTTTGTLSGAKQVFSVAPVSGRYVIELPAASAALLTVPGQAR